MNNECILLSFSSIVMFSFKKEVMIELGNNLEIILVQPFFTIMLDFKHSKCYIELISITTSLYF